MAKLTWLGEDSDGVPGPSFTIAFGGIKFPKGQPVDVEDKNIVYRARLNPFFDVSGVSGPAPKAKARPDELQDAG